MRFLSGLFLGLLLFSSLPAEAQQPPVDESAQAKALYSKGMAHFQLEEYDAAIEKWQEGFRIRPVPEFLYNIGQAYRLSRRPEKALSFYQKYLRMAPKAPNRSEVERHIASLSKVVEQQQQAASQPPVNTLPAPDKSTHATNEGRPAELPSEPVKVEPKAAEPSSSRADLVAPAPPRDQRPVYKKGWFWGVVGGAAAVVAAAVVVGVVVANGDSLKTLPPLKY
jgi:tetratricopeptide (TPR) repeat protein